MSRLPKIVTTLAQYDARSLLADSLAGITVATVALPLSIAIAIASGVPPVAGLITAVVGGLLISLLGGSRVQIGGPTGAFIVVVYGIVHQYGYGGLQIATLMAGIILLVAGMLRAGRLIRLVPESVVEGFTVGIAIVIAASQIGDLAGLSVDRLPADFLPKLEALWAARAGLVPASLALGLATALLIVFLRRRTPRSIPWPAIIVGLASALGALALPEVETVRDRFGPIAFSLSLAPFPAVDFELARQLFPSALTIAFLAGIESLLSAIVADRMTGGAHRSNAELIGQGAANIASPLMGGIPATGAIARTATNIAAGARTPVSGIVHSLAIALAMLFIPDLAGMLALPALAGLLLVTAYTMSEPHRWGERLRMPRPWQGVFFLTIALTVLVDLTVAIAVGTALGLALDRVQQYEASGAQPARARPWHAPLRWVENYRAKVRSDRNGEASDNGRKERED